METLLRYSGLSTAPKTSVPLLPPPPTAATRPLLTMMTTPHSFEFLPHYALQGGVRTSPKNYSFSPAPPSPKHASLGSGHAPLSSQQKRQVYLAMLDLSSTSPNAVVPTVTCLSSQLAALAAAAVAVSSSSSSTSPTRSSTTSSSSSSLAHLRPADKKRIAKTTTGASSTASANRGGAKKKNLSRTCAECGTSRTLQWRLGPDGQASLCNACGQRFQRRKIAQQQQMLKEKQQDHHNHHLSPSSTSPVSSPLHQSACFSEAHHLQTPPPASPTAAPGDHHRSNIYSLLN